MYVLFTDETNLDPSTESRFFIYGGLFFHIDRLVGLHRGIRNIKLEAGYGPGDLFKFHTRSRPAHVSPESHTEAKRQLIDLCLECECKFIAHLILHNIISQQDRNENIQWAINYVIGKFNMFLGNAGECGMCIVDNLPVGGSQFSVLSDKFNYGLDFEDGRRLNLDRIKIFASTSVNASHLASAMDIVLGAFRYCVNDPRNIEAAREMMRNVVQMMYIDDDINSDNLPDGLISRPPLTNIRVQEYRQQYEELFSQIESLMD